jgi:rod shape determining protein RodA
VIYSISYETNGELFIRQAIYLLVSIVCYFFLANLKFDNIISFSPLYYFLALLLLIITVFVGVESFGSTRWIDLGFITVQGSEFAKPVLLLTFAYFFARNPATTVRNVFLSLVLILPFFLLVFKQPDLGSSFILLSTWLVTLFLSGLPLLYLVGLGFTGLVAALLGWGLLQDYQKNRILTFLNPSSDPQGTSYNLVQALIAFGSGQIVGRGLGRGTQSQLDFLPAGETDFIFASTGEALGFVGISLIIALFAVLTLRLVVLALAAKKKESKIFIFGSAFVLFLQFFVNSGMNMGILPITGITLPFVSFGGSSLLSSFIILGLVQSAYESSKRV